MCDTLSKWRRLVPLVSLAAIMPLLSGGCRAATEPNAAAASSALPAAAPRASAPEASPIELPPAAVMQGTTCRPLDAAGRAAVGRLLGAGGEEPFGAGQCAAGERLEVAVELAARASYQPKVVVLAPVQSARVVLEVNAQVVPTPLATAKLSAPEGDHTVLSFPKGGLQWDGQATTARLAVVVEDGAGVVGVLCGRTDDYSSRSTTAD